MWSLLFAIALLASAHGQSKTPLGGLMDAARGMLSLRSDANSVRIAGLESQVDDLSKMLDSLGDVPDFKELQLRVDNLEGSRCDADDEFNCGGATSQCVGRLLVCDGIQDCANGNDEQNCGKGPKPGSSWLGFVKWTGCTHTRVETPVRVFVTGENTSKFYGGQTGLTFTVALEVKDRLGNKSWISSSHTGYYNAGSGNMVVEPAGPRRIGMSCNFDGNNWDRCEATVMHAGSYSSCGGALMVRE